MLVISERAPNLYLFRMSLKEYRKKRDFKKTREPEGKIPGTRSRKKNSASSFVIQKHAASRLHYDFRLEIDGALASWAVPKGPSLNPAEKRLAVHVEDHPLSYADFEGSIPEGEYGAGDVIVWDNGTWQTIDGQEPKDALKSGKLKFKLKGKKLKGIWNLVRMKTRDDGDNWLLIKEEDKYSDPEQDILITKPKSVISRRSLP